MLPPVVTTPVPSVGIKDDYYDSHHHDNVLHDDFGYDEYDDAPIDEFFSGKKIMLYFYKLFTIRFWLYTKDFNQKSQVGLLFEKFQKSFY